MSSSSSSKSSFHFENESVCGKVTFIMTAPSTSAAPVMTPTILMTTGSSLLPLPSVSSIGRSMASCSSSVSVYSDASTETSRPFRLSSAALAESYAAASSEMLASAAPSACAASRAAATLPSSLGLRFGAAPDAPLRRRSWRASIFDSLSSSSWRWSSIGRISRAMKAAHASSSPAVPPPELTSRSAFARRLYTPSSTLGLGASESNSDVSASLMNEPSLANRLVPLQSVKSHASEKGSVLSGLTCSRNHDCFCSDSTTWSTISEQLPCRKPTTLFCLPNFCRRVRRVVRLVCAVGVGSPRLSGSVCRPLLMLREAVVLSDACIAENCSFVSGKRKWRADAWRMLYEPSDRRAPYGEHGCSRPLSSASVKLPKKSLMPAALHMPRAISICSGPICTTTRLPAAALASCEARFSRALASLAVAFSRSSSFLRALVRSVLSLILARLAAISSLAFLERASPSFRARTSSSS